MIVRQGRNKSNKKLKNYEKTNIWRNWIGKRTPKLLLNFESMKIEEYLHNAKI